MRSTGCGKRLTRKLIRFSTSTISCLTISFSLWFLRTSAWKRWTGQLGAAACFHLGLGELEALLLKLDGLIQSLKPFVERHEPVIILGNLRDQTGHEVVPPLTGGEVALLGRVPGIPQLPPDVQLPEEVEAYQEIRQRIGKVLAGEIFELVLNGSLRRVEAGFVQRRRWPRP